MGETALRTRVGKTKGEPFLVWSLDVFQPLQKEERRAIVLLDCRPEAKTLDVLIVPIAGGSVRLQMRTVTLDKRTVGWAAEAVNNYVEAGHPF
jgi:hypothetical protein